MKINKKSIGIIAGLICLILVVVLLLTMCNDGTADPAPTQPTEAAPTEPVRTEPPTEPATEPTEVPTEPAEEPTEPEKEEKEEENTPSGSSRPGGTGGPGLSGGNTGNSGSTGDDGNTDSGSSAEPEKITVSAPGSQDNPYAEVLAQIPDTFTTVKVSADETVSYNVYNADGAVMTIEDASAVIVYGETTCTADENGIVTVVLAAEEEGEPVVFQVSSSASEAAAFVLSFSEPLGGATNPEILESVDQINVNLEAGDEDGYYYQWTADQDGTLTIAVEQAEPADAAYDIILTNGETQISLSENHQTDEFGRPSVSAEVAAGDAVTIQVRAAGEELPALQLTLSGTLVIPYGSEGNPILLNIPTDTITLAAGETLYYQNRAGGMIMTLNGENVTVSHNETDYTAADGAVTLECVQASFWDPCIYAITNHADTEATYTVSFDYPVGSQMNPAELILGLNTAALEEGNSSGYWYTWTAQDDGKLSIIIRGTNTTGWSYSVANETTFESTDTHWSDDETVVATETISVSKGDVIKVMVSTYDPSNLMGAPAGTVTFTAAFAADPGTAANPIAVNGEFPIVTDPIAPGDEVHYRVSGAANLILTIEDEDAYVIIADQTYPAVDGVVKVQLDNKETMEIIVGNVGAEEESYTVNITEPLPTGEATYKVTVMDYDGSLKAGVQIRFLQNGEVVAEEATNASGIATAVLERESYTVQIASSGLYYDKTTAVLTARITSLELLVTETTATELVEWKDSRAGKTYSGYAVSGGATHAQLAEGINYFRFKPEQGGTYRITTSNPDALISYWGTSAINFRNQNSSSSIDYDEENNCFTIEISDSAASNANRYYYLGITTAAESDCILTIFPVDTEEAAVMTVEAAPMEEMETVITEPAEPEDSGEAEESVHETEPEADEAPEVTEPAATETEADESGPETTEPEAMGEAETAPEAAEPAAVEAEDAVQSAQEPAEPAVEAIAPQSEEPAAEETEESEPVQCTEPESAESAEPAAEEG